MKKTFILTTVCVLLAFGIVGCKSKKEQSFSYDASDITAIEIETGGNAVSIVRSTGDEINVSYSEDVAILQDGVLKINIPLPDAGISIKKQSDLTVSVPDMVFDAIRIKSEVGNVTIQDVRTDELTAQTQYGDITLSGVAGHVVGKTDLGSIKTTLAIGDRIKSMGNMGQTVDGQIGESGAEITLSTNTGTIELK